MAADNDRAGDTSAGDTSAGDLSSHPGPQMITINIQNDDETVHKTQYRP